MSNSTAINNIFGELDRYLVSIKESLDHLDRVREMGTYDDLIELLPDWRSELTEIQQKLRSYKADEESTIQQIDSIILANANARGGKRHQRKTRKTRKMRNHRKK